MHQEYLDAEVIAILDETPVVRRYFFRVNSLERFEFQAGQFVMIDLPIEHKYTYRSYSIASEPNDTNIFELCVVLKPDGAATPYLFDHVEVGSIVKTTKALGKFTLPETIDTDLCFIATGTGVAPLRSMIRDIYRRGLPHKQIYLFFGNRKAGDILYHQEFLDLAAEHLEFNYIPVLSRETPDTWPGAHGYVHACYEPLYTNKPPVTFYICGWGNMVKEARDRLKAIGYTRTELKFELYD